MEPPWKTLTAGQPEQTVPGSLAASLAEDPEFDRLKTLQVF